MHARELKNLHSQENTPGTENSQYLCHKFCLFLNLYKDNYINKYGVNIQITQKIVKKGLSLVLCLDITSFPCM